MAILKTEGRQTEEACMMLQLSKEALEWFCEHDVGTLSFLIRDIAFHWGVKAFIKGFAWWLTIVTVGRLSLLVLLDTNRGENLLLSQG
jgi:hypothetical protein